MSIGTVIAIVFGCARILHPAVVPVIIAVWRAVDPFAFAIIIADCVGRFDAGGVPAIVFVVIAIGTAAVRIRLCNLIGDNSANYSTDDSADCLIAASGDHISANAAGDGATHCGDCAVGTLAITILLRVRANRDHRSGGETSRKKDFAHDVQLQKKGHMPDIWRENVSRGRMFRR